MSDPSIAAVARDDCVLQLQPQDIIVKLSSGASSLVEEEEEEARTRFRLLTQRRRQIHPLARSTENGASASPREESGI